MRAGALRNRIEIYALKEVFNEYGEAELEETLFKRVWAFMNAIDGNEKYISDKQMSEITHKFEIRYLKGLDESFFIKFKGRIFDIKALINPYEKNEKLLLNCVERKRDIK